MKAIHKNEYEEQLSYARALYNDILPLFVDNCGRFYHHNGEQYLIGYFDSKFLCDDKLQDNTPVYEYTGFGMTTKAAFFDLIKKLPLKELL